jgi:alpha-tubulin suppressor-like RCC1 family protein
VALSSGGCAHVVQIAVAGNFTCALLASGRVMCWGRNDLGQLGNATGLDSWVPVKVQRLDDAVEVSAGDFTTCARRRMGGVVCWGWNSLGQADASPERVPLPFVPSSVRPGTVARGVEDWLNIRPWPAPVGIDDAVTIAQSGWHGCAARASTDVTCWGDNKQGNIDPTLPRIPFQRREIVGLPHAVEMATTADITCLRTRDRQVWCWGSAQGEPRRMPGLDGADHLARIDLSLCARVPAKGWSCWTDAAALPVPAPAPSDTVQRAFNTLLLRTGEVYEGPADGSAPPERVSLPKAVAVASEFSHACALTADGEVWCWGINNYGQLGRRTPTDEDRTPAPVVW